MGEVKLVKSIYTGTDVTALGELTTSDSALIPGTLEIANSDTTISRASAGVIAVNGTPLSPASNDAYGASWDGVTNVAPSKNAVYDKIEALSAGFPSGTKMLFYQDTAPTGWTIDNTLDDKVVYITKGSAAGGQTGGDVHSTGTWTQPNHTHTTLDHTLTVDEMPSHNHGIGSTVSAVSVGGTVNNASANTSHHSTYTGGGKAHNHGSTGNGATANTWRPAAYNCIICSKN